MLDRARHAKAAEALRRFVDGITTNDEFGVSGRRLWRQGVRAQRRWFGISTPDTSTPLDCQLAVSPKSGSHGMTELSLRLTADQKHRSCESRNDEGVPALRPTCARTRLRIRRR